MARFKRASADEARSRREGHVRKAAGGDAVIKGFRSPPSWDATKRSARYTMSSESVDRYGDIVGQAGLDTVNFMANPQGLLFHNSRSWPCGSWSDITKILNGRPKRTEGLLTLLPEGVDPDVDRAAGHVAAGTIRTVSIGFIPNWDEIELILDDNDDYVTGLKFNESELIECSLVPIPANPDALAKGAGGDLQLARDLIEDVLDNYAKTPEGLLLPMDEFRAKHLDLVGHRSFHIVKGLLREAPKTVPVADMKMKATTDEEAAVYIGASVRFDQAHAENKEWPASEWKDCTGEVLDSYIVDEGEFKGVHGLAVEWSQKDGTPVGMFRGLRAERVFLSALPTANLKGQEGDPAGEPGADGVSAKDFILEAGALTIDDLTVDQVSTVAKNITTLTIDVDTDEAVKKIGGLQKLVDTLGSSFRKAFGHSEAAAVVEERAEPVVDTAPTAEQIATAKANAKSVLADLESKGRIAA